ncbi:FAD-dependent monooxygenase OpS4 [Zalerion maritima]|uniref:FAD-dependent monooxygenase OpS4 n=1 Tax=Zalerion maritima TaxID=339359 RepID=A0AAD5RMA0_9PEZI|nr:FAD-dependent monooxygenase OpS4 [Zalerion maritima]
MLNVVIVGGGIAGFAAAISLRRAGHAVHIYERSSFNNEIGAAIHLCPNAARALLAWGLDPVRAKFVVCKCSFRAKGDTLEKFHVGKEDYIEEKFGVPWFLCHRVDLHEELKRLATEPEGAGTPAEVHLKSEVVKYAFVYAVVWPRRYLSRQLGSRNSQDRIRLPIFDTDGGVLYLPRWIGPIRLWDSETPSITLSDGEVIKGDLVIAADGVHTLSVEEVIGRVNPPEPQDHYNFCYRFLIPAADIEADPDTKFWQDGDDGRMKFLVGNLKRIVSYPCRNNEVQNFVAIFHNADVKTMEKEDWQKSVDKSKLVELYHDFHPNVIKILEKATEVKQWALLFRPPIPSWTKGKMALAGDAAHPMLPHQGQGGAQGIEDGVVMGMALIGATPVQVADRIKMYEKIRINRASVMQIFSNAGQEEPERIRDEASKFIPADEVPKTPEEFFQYNFGYDVIRDTVQQMEAHDSSYKLPENYWTVPPKRGVYP